MTSLERTRTDGAAAIEFVGVDRAFGKAQALSKLDLWVPRGAVFGLLGNNGAGKTTCIRVALGLLPPDAGKVRVLGMDPQRQREQVLCAVGLVSENDDPYEWMRLQDLFRVARAAYPSWDEEVCRELCDLFQLDLRKTIGELSKGMLAKAKLVVALAHGPECLVLDEPTSGLDPGSQRELLSLIDQLSRDRGITTLFSSHHIADVSAIATHVGIIHDGRLAFQQSMQVIRERYGVARRSPDEPGWAADLLAQAVAEDSFAGTASLLLRDRRSFAGRAGVEPATLEDVFHLVTARRPVQPPVSQGSAA